MRKRILSLLIACLLMTGGVFCKIDTVALSTSKQKVIYHYTESHAALKYLTSRFNLAKTEDRLSAAKDILTYADEDFWAGRGRVELEAIGRMFKKRIFKNNAHVFQKYVTTTLLKKVAKHNNHKVLKDYIVILITMRRWAAIGKNSFKKGWVPKLNKAIDRFKRKRERMMQPVKN